MSELIQISSSWSWTAGACFGVRESTLTGTVTLAVCVEDRLSLIEAALPAYLDEPLPAAVVGQAAAARLVALLMFAQCAIQRQSRIALTRVISIRPVDGHPHAASTFEVSLPSAAPDPSKVAMKWAMQLLNRLATGDAPDAHGEREAVHEMLKQYAPAGLNLFNILSAAHDLDLPVQTLSAATIVLGTGARSRWMESSLTDATPALAVKLAKSKLATAQVLRAAGLPGGDNLQVRSAAQAIEAARQLGYPVVVKPSDMQQGVGVSADLRDEAAVTQAYAMARDASPNVLVEKWAPGFTHRLTVFNGKVIRVTRRIAGGVFGDGVHALPALIEQRQHDEMLTRVKRRTGRVLLELDDEARDLLRQNGLSTAYVPQPGEYVRLRRRDNVNAGGTNEAVTLEEAHPENLRLAVDASALLRLDFAGVDLITPDITRSWLEAGALICEVNGQPQLGTRSEPLIYHRILGELLGDNCRIPAQLVICPADDVTMGHALDQLLLQGKANGVSCAAGLWIDGRRATGPFTSGFAAARAVLRRTDVQGAACLMSMDEVSRAGLPLARWDRIDMVDRRAHVTHDDALVARVSAMVRPHQ